MAKFRLAGAKRKNTGPAKSGVPCIILMVSGMVLMLLLFYFVMKSK